MTLLIVLGVVALLAIIVVSFLLKTNTESASAASYSAVNSAQQLVDTTVNLVQAQINDAVAQGEGTVWASQPGALRVFDQNGGLRSIYRLYSASNLKADTASEIDADVPPTGWAQKRALWTDLNAPVKSKDISNAEVVSYPILDPRGLTSSIEGLEVNNPPGATSDQPVPMPVKWIYVLKNGEMVPPQETSSEIVSIPGANKENPIVGRIAYWTDDESSKVNINTASVGSFWDVPRFDFSDDVSLAGSQPAAKEYQRYPGHPATTTLAKVLPMLSADQIYAMTPRYNEGGSKGGTAVASGPVPDKSERLYPSVGELLLTPSSNGQGLSRQQVDSAQFLLTARSRAPEINLFGKPRISIWPIHQQDNETHRSANDRLMAFASSAAGKPFYFSRSDPRSSTADISGSRNSELLNYLSRLTSSPIPGFGGRFSAKYNDDKDQILTEIFDYVRTINLRDSSGSGSFRPYADPDTNGTAEPGEGQVVPSFHSGWDTMGFGRFYKVIEASVIFVAVGEGGNTTVTPNVAAIPVDARQAGSMTPAYPGTPPNNHRAVQALFVLTFFDPALGWSSIGHDFTVQVDGLQEFNLASQSLGMPLTGNMWIGGAASSYMRYSRMNGSRPFGGVMDFRVMLATRRLGNSDPTSQFPFYSKIVDVPLQPPAPLPVDTMSFEGGSITVRLYSGNSILPGDLVQTYTISFPSVDLPIPRLSDYRVMGRASGINVSSPVDRFDNVTGSTSRRRMLDTSGSETTSNDVVLSMVCRSSTGDYRLLARRTVPDSYFQLHPDTSVSRRLAHGMVQGDGNRFTGNRMGTLVSGANYPLTRLPILPATVTSAITSTGAPGDWDTALPNTPDGPYINKPDEGNILNLSTATPYYNTPQSNEPVGATFFSPNRQAVSPVMFGSLPSGVKAQKPWQTLLFRPGPGNHPGERDQPASGAPPDHLLLDLFWMPTVEPYAISEPFSTAGKVNLNYQIAPFSYITRNTALRSVLANVKTAKVSKAQPRVEAGTPLPGYSGVARVPLNLSDSNGTLRQFREKFSGGDIFRSASEICDIYMVPQGDAWSSDAAAKAAWYGDAFAMVGDNVRERPYAEIYPRVTTQSNTFTVHYEVQVLKNPPTADQGQWNESIGKVVGEYRGSTMIERYIDPNDPKLLTNDYDFANNANALSLETLYRWRTVENRQFAP